MRFLLLYVWMVVGIAPAVQEEQEDVQQSLALEDGGLKSTLTNQSNHKLPQYIVYPQRMYHRALTSLFGVLYNAGEISLAYFAG